MENNKYNVIILNTEISEPIVAKMASLFKISAEQSKNILQKKLFIIKKETDKVTAEKFHKAITAAGVNCKIEEIIDEEDTELPTIEVMQSNTKVKPLTDITRQKIEPLHSEQVDLSLEARPIKKDSSIEEKVFENIDPDNFCPDCGTIRASADSICVHCDYNPQELKRKRTKTIAIWAIIIIIVLTIITAAGLPFYQRYAKRMQVIDDLKLAFNARNEVTDFINKTNFWPNQNIDAGLEKQISNRSIKSVIVGNKSVITVIIRAQVLDGEEKTLVLTPNILKGQIVWNCVNGTLPEEFRPDICIKRNPVE